MKKSTDNFMNIDCPHCHFEYKPDDLAHTLKNGNFKCPICGKKIPSPLAGHESSSTTPIGKYLVLVFIFLGIVAVFAVNHFSKSVEKTTPQAIAVAPVITPPGSSPLPAQAVTAPVSPAVQAALPPQQAPDKMQIIERIAAGFHKSHSYTLEGGFVCLDMAIDVWNQLKTYGIEAKIMGGNIKENITAWNYRQLAMEGNHAWVIAKLSPTEKVAIETTAGTVIKQDMKDASAYFKGIEFDDPAQIKRFELLRKKANEVCREANELISDWNQNVAGKQHKSEETIAKQSRIEQRKQDCENTFKDLKEFESKAIFY
jgi:ribosomal protein S27E